MNEMNIKERNSLHGATQEREAKERKVKMKKGKGLATRQHSWLRIRADVSRKPLQEGSFNWRCDAVAGSRVSCPQNPKP